MEIIWTQIAGDKNSVNMYEPTISCNLFCRTKEIKITNYILTYKNNILEMKHIDNKSSYNLTYIPERSCEFVYFFLCKQIGDASDLYLSLHNDMIENIIICELSDVKPYIVKKYHYNSYTHKFTETINEVYKRYKPLHIDKPSNIYPPNYDSI